MKSGGSLDECAARRTFGNGGNQASGVYFATATVSSAMDTYLFTPTESRSPSTDSSSSEDLDERYGEANQRTISTAFEAIIIRITSSSGLEASGTVSERLRFGAINAESRT